MAWTIQPRFDPRLADRQWRFLADHTSPVNDGEMRYQMVLLANGTLTADIAFWNLSFITLGTAVIH